MKLARFAFAALLMALAPIAAAHEHQDRPDRKWVLSATTLEPQRGEESTVFLEFRKQAECEAVRKELSKARGLIVDPCDLVIQCEGECKIKPIEKYYFEGKVL